MPIYDYLCGACGHLLEVIHGINQEGPRFCPNCGAEGRMKKAITASAVLYKGSGWAKKDRKAISSPAKASSGDSKSSATGDKDSSKTKTASEGGSSAPSTSSSSSEAASTSTGGD
jgi:putative FmdB family regulatory protein